MAAIYMWFDGVDVTYTTTLYPLEAWEAVVFTVDIASGAMREIPRDTFLTHAEFISGTITQIRYEQNIPEDTYLTHAGFISGTITQIRFEQNIPEDTYLTHAEFIGGIITPKLITIYKPPDGTEFYIDLDYNNCSMDAV